jgi:hypothetical protein
MKRQFHTKEVILAMASPEPNTGCWLWTPTANNGRGYGRMKYKGKCQQAHRVIYELVRGQIPDGLELDHKCRVTFCVNPDHLEPVPHKVNVRRGATGMVTTIRQRSKTHCPRGHFYSDKNTMIGTGGARSCRECHNARRRKHGTK